MGAVDTARDGKATVPYLPYKTFRNFLERLAPGIPTHIDRTTMRSFSGAAQTQLLTALKSLGLINQDETPTAALEPLVQAIASGDKAGLRSFLAGAYPWLFEDFDLTKATPKSLAARFDGQGVSGDTTRKSIAFFLAAARDAEISLSTYIKSATRVSRARGPRRMTREGNGHRPDLAPEEEETDYEQPPEGTRRITFSVPDKADAVLWLPENFDRADWEMLKSLLEAYVGRMLKREG